MATFRPRKKIVTKSCETRESLKEILAAHGVRLDDTENLNIKTLLPRALLCALGAYGNNWLRKNISIRSIQRSISSPAKQKENSIVTPKQSWNFTSFMRWIQRWSDFSLTYNCWVSPRSLFTAWNIVISSRMGRDGAWVMSNLINEVFVISISTWHHLWISTCLKNCRLRRRIMLKMCIKKKRCLKSTWLSKKKNAPTL